MPVPEQIVHDYANHMVHGQRQMPVFSHVGKGEKGDSCGIVLAGDDADCYIQTFMYNSFTGDSYDSYTPTGTIPIRSFIPILHYELWTGVREVDGILMNVYYIKYSAEIEIRATNESDHEIDSTVQLWNFTTPYTMTTPFFGDEIPEDTMIQSDRD